MPAIGQKDPTEEIAELQPWIVWLEDKVTQAWLRTVKRELNDIERWAWQVGADDPFGVYDGALMGMGLPKPRTQEEIYTAMMCFRSVVNFWRRGITGLEKKKERYESLQRQLLKKEGNRNG